MLSIDKYIDIIRRNFEIMERSLQLLTQQNVFNKTKKFFNSIRILLPDMEDFITKDEYQIKNWRYKLPLMNVNLFINVVHSQTWLGQYRSLKYKFLALTEYLQEQTLSY